MKMEEQLREAASKGLVSLTLYAEWSADRKTTYWTCRATPSARHGYVGVEHALDPVEAITECLKALPGAKLREKKEPRMTNGSELDRYFAAEKEKATAAVTEEKTGSFDEWMKL